MAYVLLRRPISKVTSPRPAPASGGGNALAPMSVSTPHDRYEREADRIADEVTRTASRPMASGIEPREQVGDEALVQRECAACRAGSDDRDDEMIMRKPAARGPSASDGASVAAPDLHAGIERARRSGGHRLPREVRGFLEPRLGWSLSDVRIHADATAAGLAQQLHARAFTKKQDVFFGSGEYRPQTTSGRRLLAHELVHTRQQTSTAMVQRSMAPPTTSTSPAPSTNDDRCTDADFVDPESGCSWRLVMVETADPSVDALNREFYASQIESVRQRIDAVPHPSPKGSFELGKDGRFHFVPTYHAKGTSPAHQANAEFASGFFKPTISGRGATVAGLLGDDPMTDLPTHLRAKQRLEATFRIWREVIISSREGDTASINIAGGSNPGITLGSGLFESAVHQFLARLPPSVRKLYFEFGFSFEDGQIVALDTDNGKIVYGDDAIRLIAGDQQRMAVFVTIAMSQQGVDVPAAAGQPQQVEARLAIARAMFKEIVSLFGLFKGSSLEKLAKLSDEEVRRFLVKIFYASTNKPVASAISSALSAGSPDRVLDAAVENLIRKRTCDDLGVSRMRLLGSIGRNLDGARQKRAENIVDTFDKSKC